MNPDYKSLKENKYLEKLLFHKTTQYIDEQKIKFRKQVFNKLYEDIHNFIYQHQGNLILNIFEGIKAYLLGKDKFYIDINIKDFFKEIGFNAEKFRNQIFIENKESIKNSITDQFISERLQKSFDSYFRKSWELEDLNTTYPQLKIIKGFLKWLMYNTDINFSELFSNELNKIHIDFINAKIELNDILLEIKRAKKNLTNK